MDAKLIPNFDTSTALSSMYLWLLFGFLSVYINCDLQRIIRSNIFAGHLVGLLAFFFLFTLTDSKASLVNTWIKTIIIYILFILTTKSKWPFAFMTLSILLIDLSYKRHVSYTVDRTEDVDEKNRMQQQQVYVSRILSYVILCVVLVGCVHYFYLQKIEYRDSFSYLTFFLGKGKCGDIAPDYAKLARMHKN